MRKLQYKWTDTFLVGVIITMLVGAYVMWWVMEKQDAFAKEMLPAALTSMGQATTVNATAAQPF